MKTPEAEKKTSSGVTTTPEVREIKPKVLFSNGSKPQPDPKEAMKKTSEVEPKVLRFDKPSSEPSKVQETVKPAIQPKILFGKTAQTPHVAIVKEERQPVKPTVVLPGGTARKRIEATPYELRTMVGGLCEEAVIVKALELIKVTNLDDGRDEKAMNWGSELQRRLSTLLDEETALLQSGTIDGSKREIAEIFQILSRLNLESGNAAASKGGLIASITKRVRSDNPKSRFDAAYKKLQSAISRLESRLPELSKFISSVNGLIGRTKALATEIEAAIIAGNFLTQYVRSGKYIGEGESVRLEGQMQTLDQRVESLTSTQATLKLSLVQREFLAKSAAHIIDCVQNTLLVDIPAWRTNYLCVLTAIMSGGEPDGSVFEELVVKQRKILERIQV